MHSPSVAYITAGAAGMYCGSCMRDNRLVAELQKLGCDSVLIPTYTPIRTDEGENVSLDRIFFGGINVFLQEKVPFFRYLPRMLDRWLDNPWLIQRVAAGGMSVDARELGGLTVSMLQGEYGHQRKEFRRLTDWLAHRLRPRLVNFTNILIAAAAPQIKQRLGIPVVVTLQGDDLFLDGLISPFREEAYDLVRSIAGSVDAFITFSRDYAERMAKALGVPQEKVQVVPLGVDSGEYTAPNFPPRSTDSPPTLGYFARICPAKGFHLAVDAFLLLRQTPGMEHVRMHCAGWLGESDRSYFETQRQRIDEAGASEAFSYLGAVDRSSKLAFFRSVDVLSVPTTYREPKGLFVLESLASGTPVVQPAHGSFPEILERTGGGRLFPPGDQLCLVQELTRLLRDPAAARALGLEGRAGVLATSTAEHMARATLEVYQQLWSASTTPPSFSTPIAQQIL